MSLFNVVMEGEWRFALFIRRFLLLLILTAVPLMITVPIHAQTADIDLEQVENWNPVWDTSSVAWGDYDNDGDLDLAIGNTRFSIIEPNKLYRNDDGQLIETDWTPVEPDITFSLAWGDYNNDGFLDLAVGNGCDNLGNCDGAANRIYRNNGGMLAETAVWSSAERELTFSLAWGDYDGNGTLDLLAGNSSFTNLNDLSPLITDDIFVPAPTRNHLYRNSGVYDGSQPLMALDPFSLPDDEYATLSVDWGDFDKDGDLDLAVGNGDMTIDVNYDGLVFSQNIPGPNQIYENDGGTLTLAWESVIETDKITSLVQWGDFDADDDLDLAIGNASAVLEVTTEGLLSSSRGYVNQIYENGCTMAGCNPDFSTTWESQEEDATTTLAWGDVNGDTFLDLIVGNTVVEEDDGTAVPFGLRNRVYVNSAGSIPTAATVTIPENEYTRAVAWGDIDGDGDVDLVVGNANLDAGSPLRLYRNNTVTLPEMSAWPDTGVDSDASSLAWGDYDDDGDLDLAVAVVNGPNEIYRNDAGTLVLDTAVFNINDSLDSRSVAWGDYDQDGLLDLLIGNYDAPNQLYQNDSAGGLVLDSSWSGVAARNTTDVAWGDYNGDGWLDFALANYAQPNQIFLNNTGTFATAPDWTAPETADSSTAVAWGDYDGDGDLDLAVSNETHVNRLYRNDGIEAGTPATLNLPLVWSAAIANDSQDVAWGDMDGDGLVELAIANHGPNDLVFTFSTSNGQVVGTVVWESNAGGSGDTVGLAWGDYDGDGDLDLAVANKLAFTPDVNGLYRNEGGILTADFDWQPDVSRETLAVAWGDIDNDGDLDLAGANLDGQNELYINPRRNPISLADDPPFATVSRPGITAAAEFYSDSFIIRAAQVDVTYTLFDAESDPVPELLVDYSPNGGGQWFPATAVPGTQLTNLATAPWPTGVTHTFTWDIESDLIKSDNVVIRMRPRPGANRSPLPWAALGSQSPPFRVEVPWFIKVVDENGNAIEAAEVYGNSELALAHGVLLGSTDRAGLLNPGQQAPGTSLVALALQEERPTVRDCHDGWSSRTYTSNLTWLDDTTAAATIIGPELGEQRLTVQRNNTLVLFNLVVSVEWDATAAYIADLEQAMIAASRYLYDATDGQMAIGQVHIADEGACWADADIQVLARNIVRPHTYVGQILGDNPAFTIRLGRAWNGSTGSEGDWSALAGHRTMIHEFGHYGLFLFDEYVGIEKDPVTGAFLGEVKAYCTDVQLLEATDAVNASLMDRQYSASEFGMKGVMGMWSELCEQTLQWEFNQESDWETIVDIYEDEAAVPRWIIDTPLARQMRGAPDVVRGGPCYGDDPMSLISCPLPPLLPQLPQVTAVNTGPSEQMRTLEVRYNGLPYNEEAVVSLDKGDNVIDQGLTHPDTGTIEILGADSSGSDTVRVISFDGSLWGEVSVTTATTYTIELLPVSTAVSRAQAAQTPPFVQIRPLISANPNEVDLLITLDNFSGAATPVVNVTEPQTGNTQALSLSFSSTTGQYSGSVSFSNLQQGTGQLQAAGGALNGGFVSLQPTYRLQRLDNNVGGDLYSNDGRFHLSVPADNTLPGVETYYIVNSSDTVPGSLPNGLALVGNVYDLTASSAVSSFGTPAILNMSYDDLLTSGDVSQIAIYRWQSNTNSWQRQEDSFYIDEENRLLSVRVQAMGIYALMDGEEIELTNIFLPVIMKQP